MHCTLDPLALAGEDSCSTKDKFRCFHAAAAAVCLGRNRDAASRTAFRSIIPKQFFSSILILTSGSLILSSTHRGGADGRCPRPQRRPDCQLQSEGCNFSFTERQMSPRDVFLQEFSHPQGPNFLGVNVLLVTRDAIFWDVSRDFLRFRQRVDPLVVIELLRCRIFHLLQEHQLRIEQEAALFRQVSRGPLQARPLASSCEGGNGVQVFLPFSSMTRSTHWRQFDVRQGGNTCFARLGTLRTGGMNSNARARPVPAAVCRALRGAAHQSPHGFAEGSSGCQGTCSFPAMFIRLWLHDLTNQIADLSRLPQLEPLFQLGVPCRHLQGSQPGASDSSCGKAGPKKGDCLWLLQDFLPKPWRIERPPRECHRRGPAKLGEQLLVLFC